MRPTAQHRLLFAFRPPLPLVEEIGSIRDALAPGRAVGDELLHMTLLPFPLFPDYPERLAERLVAALSALRFGPCRVIVDRLVAANGRALLLPSEPLPRLQSFQALLECAVRQAGLRPLRAYRFSPHLSLCHEGGGEICVPVDPISWTAEELVLIHSRHGEGVHETVARWPLMPREAPPIASRRGAR